MEKETMEPRQSVDPFEVAFKDVEELPPDSPTADSMDIEGQIQTPANVLTLPVVIAPAGTNASTGNNEDEDEDEEDDNVDINIRNISYKRDPDKAARTQYVEDYLSSFCYVLQSYMGMLSFTMVKETKLACPNCKSNNFKKWDVLDGRSPSFPF